MESTFNINNPSPGSQPGVRITLRRNSTQRKKEHKCLLDGASSGFPSSQLLCDFHLGMTRKVCSEQIVRSSTLAWFASRRVSSQVCPPHFTRQLCQRGATAERDWHKNCTVSADKSCLQLVYFPFPLLLTQGSRQKGTAQLCAAEAKLENALLFKPKFLRRTLGLQDTPQPLGKGHLLTLSSAAARHVLPRTAPLLFTRFDSLA